MAIDQVADEDSPLIYGLEFQSRALCSHSINLNNDNTAVRFVVGTQSIKCENQVHLLEFNEENNTLSKAIFRHSDGEIWDVSSSEKFPNLIATSYSNESHTSQGKINNNCSIWRFPIDLSNNLIDEDLITSNLLEKVCDLKGDEGNLLGRKTVWHPEDGNKIISLANENQLLLWDVESHKLISTILCEYPTNTKNVNRTNKVTSFKWSPHSNCGLIGIISGNHIYSKDLRSKSNSIAWSIPNGHGQLVRDLDFNPNAQYYLATCGDDCESKFWDVRNTNKPVINMINHSHWVWAIRYNLFHDQLVLTSSSDSRVILMRINSLASQPFGHLVENDDINDDDGDDNEESSSDIQKKKSPNKSDGIIATFEEHEDSVYAIEWAINDPWIFASLSYDGRVVINKVPKSEKFNILF